MGKTQEDTIDKTFNNYTIMKKSLLILSLLFSISFAGAQTRQQGNVVEYFGKEKIETIEEGTVTHKFTEGFVLPYTSTGGVLFTGQEWVEWMIASGFKIAPTEGKRAGLIYPEAAPMPPMSGRFGNMPPIDFWKWTKVQADTSDTFTGRTMRSAYLFTSYESKKEDIVLLDAKGGTRTFINGLPREGDHYDFGYTLIPFRLKKGANDIIYTPGRFGRVNAKLIKPRKPVLFTLRDMTLPDLIVGETDEKWAAIRVINATENDLTELSIRATLHTGESIVYPTDDVMSLSVRKVKFRLPATSSDAEEKMAVAIELIDNKGKVIDNTEISLRVVPATVHHERTFISNIDGSVQYYSVAPATESGQKALVLSVHGASVEARNQARAYKQKDWTHVVAATNRRPFGFNWEEWGRIDALEVMAEAKRVFNTIPEQTYLTGHSMGGHGTWYLGTTYPDLFAAIAPCASYPDIIGYGRGSVDPVNNNYPAYEGIRRGANAGRIKSLIHNLKQSGVYVLHGDSDNVVPVGQARLMRELLGTFHPNFCYYEYPGGSHWYGDHSVDWFPIFEFFKRQTIPTNAEVLTIDFHTASPAISSKDYWLTIEQQLQAYEFSNVKLQRNENVITIDTTVNVATITLDLPSLSLTGNVEVKAGDQTLTLPADRKAILRYFEGTWSSLDALNPTEKNALRYGGFKQAIDNRVVFVYATGGTKTENEWYKNKARFDAETFYYRGNGSIDVIPDSSFDLANYKDRNVMLYGNASNNRAWRRLLKNSPIQVTEKAVFFRGKAYSGDDLGAYFVYPRPDSEIGLIGVVSGTGEKGMRATGSNNYISGITGFPDIMVFRTDMIREGLGKMEISDYFSNDWK